MPRRGVEQTVPEPGCSATGTLTCPTVTALMPQVYLPANTSALSADGNRGPVAAE